jgi:histidine triad (HIT) family protein
MDCIFCKIINKEIPADIVWEDDDIFAFKDIQPIAPVHILIIPKEHISTIDDLKEYHQALAGKMILVAQKLARELGTAGMGYKLLFRVKHYGGQEIDHLHLHLIGGAKLAEEIYPIS